MSIDCKGQYSTPKHLNIENVSYCQAFQQTYAIPFKMSTSAWKDI